MKHTKLHSEPCPDCPYPEPTTENCKACIEQAYEKGDITDDDIAEAGRIFLRSINKELGIENEVRFTEWEEAKEADG